MKSQQAITLLTLARAVRHPEQIENMADRPLHAETLLRMAKRNARRLAARIIGGDYPALRNVVAEQEPAVYMDEPNARQPGAEANVPDLVAWYSDGEDSRYESN